LTGKWAKRGLCFDKELSPLAAVPNPADLAGGSGARPKPSRNALTLFENVGDVLAAVCFKGNGISHGAGDLIGP